MNTKQRILNAALTLLNEEGETAISAVDIANALEISPGNLYYHFKGKEEIIPALYDDFEEEMQIILQSGHKDMRSIEDQWIFAYIVLEEIWDFRFFYRNLDSILDRYPVLAPKFKRLLNAKRKAIRTNLNNLIRLDYLHIDQVLLNTLVEQNLLCFTYWLNLQEIEKRDIPAQTAIHQSVFQIMTLSVPYMGEAGFNALQGMQALLEKNLAPK